MSSKYTAEQLVGLIRERFESRNNLYNQCVVLEQVPDGTSTIQHRWIDAAVFQMWESKGLTRAAFEVKVSRHDFVHELQHPEKHQWCHDCFHEFWFVAPKDVIQIEELPVGSGWMYPRGKGLAIARNAVRNRNPRLDDSLVAAFMRAAYKEIKNSGKTSAEKILDSSKEYQDAKMYIEATNRFLESRGGHQIFPSSSDDIFKALEGSTVDKQIKQDRDLLLNVTGRFQRQMAELVSLFLVVASKSLLARDALGKHIVSVYGGQDSEGLEELKRRAKDPKSMDYPKRYAELIELIMKWEQI